MGQDETRGGYGIARPIKARSVSDGIDATVGATIGTTPCLASDPPAYAEGLYGPG